MLRALTTAFLIAGAFAMPLSAADDHAAHPHAKELKNADGSWKYTNALAKETSPYLLQHAHNPVDWYPWGKDTFDLARKTGKPIFLSIGYSTCYWCHVMERQVFENPQLAKLMNDAFINVKVDREERPDVDDIYMAAVQAMNNGRGGWPMSVILTPPGAGGKNDLGLKPIFAATYIPPAQFGALVPKVTEIWKEKKAAIVEQGDNIAESITQHLSQNYTPGDIHPAFIERTADVLMRMYDAEHGGFGEAPKFPTPNNPLFLLKAYQRQPSDEVWDAIAYTLERMARGGMYDQVAGGFHRYSVDEKWLVPHFEKMLYDNAQLVEVYLTAHAIKPDAKDPGLYPRVVRQVCDYVMREMLDETGTFWSAQDAEVDAKEGGNYVWTADEVKSAVADEKLAALALKMYGLDLGSNFRDPHDPKGMPVNVIFLPTRLDELAAAQKITIDELLKRKADIDKRMKAVRDQRKQPRTDDKVLTSWNGLMIAAFARAGKDLNEPRYTQAAQKAADYILTKMRTEDGGLYRSMRGGKVRINGFLEDYAYFTHGLLALHKADAGGGDKKWLDAAEKLTEHASKQFSVEGGAGGYYDTLANQDDLFVRTRTTYDGATPSGNSVYVNNLLSLYEATKNEKYLKHALVDLRSFAVPLRQRSVGMANMMLAAARAMELAPKQFAQAGAPGTGAKAEEPTANNPVVVALDQPKLDLKSGAATAKITLKIHKDYHVNAADPGDKNVIPISVKLEGVKGVEVDVKWPKAESKKFAFADKALNVHEGTVVIEITLKRGRMPSAANAKLVVQYQACNDAACLEPKDVVLPVELSGLE